MLIKGLFIIIKKKKTISLLSSRITFQRKYANLLSWNITQHDEFIKPPFPAKNLFKQTTYLILGAKNPSFIVCSKSPWFEPEKTYK